MKQLYTEKKKKNTRFDLKYFIIFYWTNQFNKKYLSSFSHFQEEIVQQTTPGLGLKWDSRRKENRTGMFIVAGDTGWGEIYRGNGYLGGYVCGDIN